MAVDGGWVRYNRELERLDGHCRQHGANCKMDRRLTRGALGLVLAWVSKGPTSDRLRHTELKEELSSADGFAERDAARQKFKELAATDPLAQAIVQAEIVARGGETDEPPSLPCPRQNRVGGVQSERVTVGVPPGRPPRTRRVAIAQQTATWLHFN